MTRAVGCLLLILAVVGIFLGFTSAGTSWEKIDPLHYFIGSGASAILGFHFLALARIIDLLRGPHQAAAPVKKNPESKGGQTLDIRLD